MDVLNKLLIIMAAITTNLESKSAVKWRGGGGEEYKINNVLTLNVALWPSPIRPPSPSQCTHPVLGLV